MRRVIGLLVVGLGMMMIGARAKADPEVVVAIRYFPGKRREPFTSVFVSRRWEADSPVDEGKFRARPGSNFFARR